MLDAETIQEVSRRIQERFDPERIVLFGSYAEGTADEGSDVDLLVVADTPLEPGKRYSAVRKLLADIPAGFDIVVRTPQEYMRLRSVVNTIVYFADKYGKVLYDRREAPGGTTMAG
jgi:predicted nucleotidyltransferase